MSKRIVDISSLLGFMLLLSGCGQETSLTPLPPDGESEFVEIRLNASLAQISVDVTRASTNFTTDITDGVKVGLYGIRNSSDLPGNNPYIDNWEFTTTAGALTGAAKVYFPAGREQAFLYAYSPYTAQVSVNEGHVRIPVKSGLVHTDQAPWIDAATDPLYASESPTIVRKPADSPNATASGTANFAFNHAMAKLNILVTSSSDTDSYELNGITVDFSNGQYGYMDLQNGNITPEPVAAKEFTEIYAPATSIINNVVAQFSHSVIPPASDTDNAVQKISVTINNTPYLVYETQTGPAITLKAGRQKTLKISFNPNNTTRVSLNGWETDKEQEIDYNK